MNWGFSGFIDYAMFASRIRLAFKSTSIGGEIINYCLETFGENKLRIYGNASIYTFKTTNLELAVANDFDMFQMDIEGDETNLKKIKDFIKSKTN